MTPGPAMVGAMREVLARREYTRDVEKMVQQAINHQLLKEQPFYTVANGAMPNLRAETYPCGWECIRLFADGAKTMRYYESASEIAAREEVEARKAAAAKRQARYEQRARRTCRLAKARVDSAELASSGRFAPIAPQKEEYVQTLVPVHTCATKSQHARQLRALENQRIRHETPYDRLATQMLFERLPFAEPQRFAPQQAVQRRLIDWSFRSLFHGAVTLQGQPTNGLWWMGPDGHPAMDTDHEIFRAGVCDEARTDRDNPHWLRSRGVYHPQTWSLKWRRDRFNRWYREQQELDFLDRAYMANDAMKEEYLRMMAIDALGGEYSPASGCHVSGCQWPANVRLQCMFHGGCGDSEAVQRVVEFRRDPMALNPRIVSQTRVKRCSRRGFSAVWKRYADRPMSVKKAFQGVAHALFPESLKHVFNFPDTLSANAVLRIPAVEDLVANLTARDHSISWATVISECVFFMLHMYHGGFTLSNFTVSIAHFLKAMPLRGLLSQVPDFTKWIYNAQADDHSSELNILGVCISALVSVFGLVAFASLPTSKDIDQFIMRFSRVGQCISSVERSSGVINRLSEYVVDFIRVSVLGYGSSDLKEWEGIDRFCDEVQALNVVDFEHRVSVDGVAIKAKIDSLLNRGDEIQKQLDAWHVPAFQTSRFRASCMFLIKARDIVAQSGAGQLRARIAPLVMHFVGGTGVGKSSMLDYLNTRLLVALGSKDPEDLVNKVYYRTPQSEFFDGFRNGTDIVVCDDFGAIKDSETKPSPEPVEQIRMGNTAPFRPPMAHLSDKANAVFEAKAVIWTTNRDSFRFQSLTNPEAVHNRVHLRFRQKVAPEFAKTKNIDGVVCDVLDTEKVAAAAAVCPEVGRECMLFDQLSVEGVAPFKVVRANLTFNEMADICVEALKNKQSGGTLMLAERKKYYLMCAGVSHAGGEEGRDVVGNDDYVPPERVVNPEYISYLWRPNWLQRYTGLVNHINVRDTVRHRIALFPDEIAPVRSEFAQNEQTRFAKILAAHCVRCPVEHEQKFAELAAKAYLNYSEGRMMSMADYTALVRLPVEVCGFHTDHNAEELLATTLAKRAAKITRTKMSDLCSWYYKQLTSKNPIRSFLAVCLLVPVGMGIVSFLTHIISTVITWCFPNIYGGKKKGKNQKKSSTVLNTEAYSTGVASRPNGNVEMYANGVPALPHRNVEAYSTGVVSRPNGNVEAYTTGATARPQGNVEAQNTSASALPPMNAEAYSHSVSARPGGTVEMGGEAHSVSDQNAWEVRARVLQNCYQIWTAREDKVFVPVGTMTFVQGRIGLTNRHIMEALLPNVRLVHANGLTYDFPKSDLVVAVIPDSDALYGQRDVCVFECPRQVQAHRDITHMFMTSGDYSRHEYLAKVCLVGFLAENPGVISFRESTACRAVHNSQFDLRGPTFERKIRDYYVYGCESQRGDCGALVIAFDPAVNRKICAIHMAGIPAGSGYNGAGVAISQGFLNQLLALLRTRARYQHSFADATYAVAEEIQVTAEGGRLNFEQPLPGTFAFGGKSHSRVYSAATTAIRPSVVADLCGPVLKKPAKLTRFRTSEGVVLDPFQIALKKAATAPVRMDPQALEEASRDVEQMLCTIARPSDRRTLTFAEAIAGIPGDDCYPPINRSTSPGYGWTKIGKGKTAWLGDGQEYVLDHPDLLAVYNSAKSRLENGKRVGHYWTDTMKDELRPADKVDQGKTRLFAAGEMVQTILLRQYFDGFVAHMARNHTEFESCVGLNVYSLEWDRLARRLQQVGKNVVAGDFSNYDGTLPAEALWEALRIINEFFLRGKTGEELREAERDNAIRELLWLEIVNSIHVHGDTVYAWDHSQPSGCPFTSILNSVVHSIIVRVVYLLGARKYDPANATMVSFHQYVRHNNYGDDDVTNVADVIPWFNQEVMAEMYATFGMTYTDETKTGELVKFKTLIEIQFLKRKFRWDEEQARYRAPLELATIKEMPCWNKTKSASDYTLTAMVLQDAVYELSHHDARTWGETYPMFEAARERLHRHAPCYLPSFNTLNNMDLWKYCVGLSFPKEGVIGAQSHSPTDSAQQILLPPSDTANRAAMSGASEGCSTLLMNVCRGKTIGYSSGVLRKPSDPTAPRRIWVNSDNSNNNRTDITDGEADATPDYAFSFGYTHSGETGGEAPDFAGSMDVVHSEQIMQMHEDGAVEQSEREVARSIPRPIQTAGTDLLRNDIVGFLERPVHMADFDWTTSQTALTRILSLTLPSQWLRVPMIWEKLQGFRYLRCTLVVEIQVNSQPFNSGALVAWFNPIASQLTYQPSSTAHFGGIFGYPHVVYRCNENTAVQLRIPFFPVMSHFDLNTGIGTMGQVHVDVFSALGGVSDADGTVWCWAEDIDVSMPTGVPNPMPTFGGEAHSGPTGGAPTQSAAAGTPATAEKVKASTNGTTETIFKVLAGVSAGLSLAPPLTALGRMGAAVFGGIGAIAHFFGWSKPTDAGMTTIVEPRLGRFMTNYDGDVKTKVLALDSRNATNIPVELFNSESDEMAFSTLISRPTWMCSFNYTAAQKQGAIIFSWPVDPSACLKKSIFIPPATWRTVRQETYLSYLASLAQFWRGGIKYKFMFMKTPFHSGRLRFVFAPGAVLATDPTTIDFNKCYSEIHDLREKADVEFEVPYSYYQPWRLTESAAPGAGNFDKNLWRDPQGMLYVQVVNSLRAPATASSDIACQVMTSGGADMQFAVPQVNPLLHVVSSKDEVPALVFSGEAHSGIYPSSTTGLEINAETIGEAFTGFRQWLKRYHPHPAPVRPYSPLDITTPTIATDLAREETAFTRAIPLYRFQSGNLRMMVVQPNATQKTYRLTAFPAAPEYQFGTTTAYLNSGIPLAETTFLEPVCEFEIPFYQPWVGIPTQAGNPTDLREGSVATPEQYARVPCNRGTFIGWDQANPGDTRVYLSTAENFSYGFLMGPPVTVAEVVLSK